jgi:PQQ-dependent dehydrogenase (methanol/ethanol family)
MKTLGSLLIVLPLLAQHTPQTDRNPFAGDPDAVVAGHKLYDQTCLGCHGSEGRGGERAPSLSGTLKRGSADGEILQNIRGGVPGSQMPAFSQLSADEGWRLVTYIKSLSGGSSSKTRHEVITGDPAAGARVFDKGECGRCHQVNGKGVAVGPDLSGAGSNSVETLRTAILDPNRSVAVTRGKRRGTQYRISNTLVAESKDGKLIRGVRINEDSFSVQMTDVSGQLHLLQKSELKSLRVEQRSLMPEDYGKRLSSAELNNLIAYLKSLDGTAAPAVITASDVSAGLSYERIRKASAEPQNWLTYWGDYGAKHYSSLSDINTSNVHSLQAQWAFQLPGDGIVEAVPLVVDGVMYTTGPPGQVFALDARTGRPIWKYQRRQKIVNPYEGNRVNRGVAMLGNRLFFGTLDGALVALDSRTGIALWETQVADTMKGYSITSAPLAVKDRIVTGVAGGEFGIRGFVDAYDPATGKRLWRFYTIPGPGEFGHDTWEGESWKQGAGASWLTGTYDPESNLIYWPIGNPGPDLDGEVRKGDNLFSCAVVALDADTGQRQWHYQFTPNDTHDWDATEAPVLVDLPYQGRERKLMIQANRNGVFYVLDRTNGKFLSAKPYVRTTWVKSWDANGRPILEPGSDSTLKGSVVYPALIGGSNFQAPSYSPLTGWLYVAYNDSANNYRRTPMAYEPGKAYWAGEPGSADPDPDDSRGIMAIDALTGAVKWKFELTEVSLSAGVLATGGGVLFAGSHEGNLIALDAKTGKSLWHFQTGSEISSSPISYSVAGRQYVAISTANVLYSFALPSAR